ncbi:MAG: TetR/AcrR family transcriptional regulator [Acidobacteriota bacterium]
MSTTRRAKRSPDDWIDAGTTALARGGLAAVRVEVLARELGVTKGSFYWHFDNRNALITAMLEAWEARQTLSIIEQVESTGGDAADRLVELSRLTDLDSDSDHEIEIALREAARRDPTVAAFVRRVDEQRMAYLRRLYTDLGYAPVDAEARSLMSYSLLVGDALISAEPVAASRRELLQACRRLLFAPPDAS